MNLSSFPSISILENRETKTTNQTPFQLLVLKVSISFKTKLKSLIVSVHLLKIESESETDDSPGHSK